MTAAFSPFSIDAGIVTRLREDFRQRGVAVLLEPALDAHLWRDLCHEAQVQRGQGAWRLLSQNNVFEINQNNMRGHLGPFARGLLHGSSTLSLLRSVTKRNLEPSWSASCYTYYDEPGSYMGEHCDKFDACRVAFLFYLQSCWPVGASPGPGLGLHVFEGDTSRSALLARVTARPNRALILNGAKQAHLRPPLAPGESLIMLAGCFRLTGKK